MNTTKTDYPFTVEASPDYAFLNITIPRGKTLRVEAEAMAAMDTSMKMKTKMKGGIKRIFSGEKLFINDYTATDGDAYIGLAPATPGDIAHIYLEDETVFVQSGSYLASGPEIQSGIEFQGFKGFFSGEKLFMIRNSGTGDLWFNTYGGLIEIDVKDRYVVDTGYIVAFTDGLTYDVRPVGGMKSFFFSKEGLVCRFSGEGKVWIQTRLAPAFVRWADAFRKVESKKN